MQLPLEDRYLMQRQELLAQLAVLLGGRTAEEIALGEISTGAQNDLQRATDIARAMVTEWGMSDALGAIHYDNPKRSRFLDIPIGPERGAYAEDTARLIDAEVKRIMTDAHNDARGILTEKRDLLERVTRRLLDIEVMEGDELRAMLGVPESAPHAPSQPKRHRCRQEFIDRHQICLLTRRTSRRIVDLRQSAHFSATLGGSSMPSHSPKATRPRARIRSTSRPGHSRFPR